MKYIHELFVNNLFYISKYTNKKFKSNISILTPNQHDIRNVILTNTTLTQFPIPNMISGLNITMTMHRT